MEIGVGACDGKVRIAYKINKGAVFIGFNDGIHVEIQEAGDFKQLAGLWRTGDGWWDQGVGQLCAWAGQRTPFFRQGGIKEREFKKRRIGLNFIIVLQDLLGSLPQNGEMLLRTVDL